MLITVLTSIRHLDQLFRICGFTCSRVHTLVIHSAFYVVIYPAMGGLLCIRAATLMDTL